MSVDSPDVTVLPRVSPAQRDPTAAANSSVQAVLGAQVGPVALSASLGPLLPVTSFMDPGLHPWLLFWAFPFQTSHKDLCLPQVTLSLNSVPK